MLIKSSINLILMCLISMGIKAIEIDPNPEFTIELNDQTKLEVFKLTHNDEIIRNLDQNNYKSLKWFSLGVPKIVSKSNKYDIGFIKFNSNGFHIFVDFLTEEQKYLIKLKIYQTHNILVEDNQIEILMNDRFKCSLFINCQEKEVEFHGFLKDNSKYPFRIEFQTNLDYTASERYCLEDFMELNYTELNFQCSISTVSSEKLKIDVAKFEELAVYDKYFDSCDSVLITPKQLDNFAAVLYNHLNVSNFNITVEEFTKEFEQEILKKRKYEYFDFLEALSTLSKNTNNNLTKPYSIYHKLSILVNFKAFLSSSSFTFKLNKNIMKELKNQSAILFEFIEPIDKFFETSPDGGDSFTFFFTVFHNISDKLNKLPHSIIEWEIIEESVIPKSIKLLKIVRSEIQNEQLIFDSIEKEFNYFERKFNLTLNHKHYIDSFSSLRNKLAGLNSALEDRARNEENNLLELKQIKHAQIQTTKEATNNLKLEGHKQTITSLIRLPNNRLASSSKDGQIKIWHTKSGKLLKSLNFHKPIYNMILLNNINEIAVVSEPENFQNHSIIIVDINKEIIKFPLVGHTDLIKSLALLENGQLVSLSYDNTIKVWNTQTSELLFDLDLNEKDIELNSIVSLSTGDLISSSTNSLIIFDINDGSIKRIYENIYAQSLVELTNGKIAFIDGLDIKIMLLEDGSIQKTLVGHKDYINSIIVLKDDLIATGSVDKSIIIWNSQDGSVKQTLTDVHGQEVTALALLDDNIIASGSTDKSIIICNIK